MDTDNHQDVKDLYLYFKLPVGFKPSLLESSTFKFRFGFLHEELRELAEAQAAGDLPGVADALVDLVYVAHGTAVMMGLPWEALWNEVHRANMRKVNVVNATDSKRNSPYDIKKPPGWVGPDITGILARTAIDDTLPERIRSNSINALDDPPLRAVLGTDEEKS